MQLHDPDGFELKKALRAFRSGESTLSEICEDLGIRPGSIYEEYVTRLKKERGVPSAYTARKSIDQHAGFDRVYNDLPTIVNSIIETYPECYLYELADYEPLPDTEWVTFFVPPLGFVKLYTSLFFELGCYVEVTFIEPGQADEAAALASRISTRLDEFYRERIEREESLAHG